MASSSVIVVCMPERGHVQRVLPLIEGLAERGVIVHSLVHSRFAGDVVSAGGRFVDLFAEGGLDEIDDRSIPIPSRYVTFAAERFAAVTQRVAMLRPRLIVYDTFAVIAPLMARYLQVPAVNFCCGHAMVPSRTVAALACDARVNTADVCRAAVTRLRDEHGMVDASPFSYVTGVSSDLNIYGEPPQFLRPDERAAFEPIAFFGSIAPSLRDRHGQAADFRPPVGRRNVYISFGSVIWRYFADVAEEALRLSAIAASGLGADVLVSLGGHSLTPATMSVLRGSGGRVESTVDQWRVLREADLFLTHHGLNSTHEAIYHRVPMLSYPFFTDQPALALRCQQLGLAVPVATSLRAPVAAERLAAAIRMIDDDMDGFAARLEEARGWEVDTINSRGEVLDRILALG